MEGVVPSFVIAVRPAGQRTLARREMLDNSFLSFFFFFLLFFLALRFFLLRCPGTRFLVDSPTDRSVDITTLVDDGDEDKRLFGALS